MSKTYLKKRKQGSSSAYDHVMAELDILKFIDHPNVVRMIEIIDDESFDKLFIITEFVKPGVVFVPSDSKWSEENIQVFVRQVTQGLEYLHQNNIFHRDIKPENVLFDSKQSTYKICDFGVSVRASNSDFSTSKTAGTPTYFPPELCSENPAKLAPADMWALGISVYRLLLGFFPYVGSSIPHLMETITKHEFDWSHIQGTVHCSPSLISLLQGLLEKDPSKRLTASQALEHPFLAAPINSSEESFQSPQEPSELRPVSVEQP